MRFKRYSTKNKMKIKETPNEKNKKEMPIINEQKLKETFEQCSDVVFSTLQFNQHDVTLIYCLGLIDNEIFYKTILLRLEEYFKSSDELNNNLANKLQLPSLRSVESLEKAENEIFSGKLLMYFKAINMLYSVNISNKPQRKPEETSLEISFKGPRDNFIEDIIVNHALIRKRLPTTSFISEQFKIGKRTKTKVFLLYMKDIANQNILKQIRSKMNDIDIDGLYSGAQLGELLNENPYAIFPRYSYTGRPDFAVQALLSGRFVILIDGVAYAILTPVTLFFLLKTAEDSETNYFYNAFERIIRVIALSAAILLPGFWVALTTFHQNQIPFTLLATIIEARKGVPLPTAMEAFLMLSLFEVFREAGMRLPLSIGQTFSVIGGLIIGDAAIRAGLTSPAMLVIIAGSTIATFTLVNQALIGIASLMRFLTVIIASLFGFLGLFASIYLFGIIIARIQSFDVPYLQVASRLSLKNAIKAFLKMPTQINTKRPSAVKPNDETNQGGSS
ncbi:spore germination protein [Schinkia azotoformans]|uniref:spore germination protein n=1 Tax=Schinkia azotoformans TaxID=1454 RepID=UPI002DBA6386|nr:spore germination protein [Schinkia azotoformans]MEC1770213.1 spore germination protein [Schinkia azotoformans]MED4365695.1 spore germination protein [Schinkia azotoformans]